MNNKEFRIMLILQGAVITLFAVGALIKQGMEGLIYIIIFGVILAGISFIITLKRYKDIGAISKRLERVLAGDNNLDVWDNSEGELSVLKSNIYKATTLLINQRERLKDEKVFLANAIADISHQLKTPLTSMMMMNDLLKEEADEGKRKEFINTQSTQLERMNWLIQTLLKISKLDTNCVEFKEERIKASDLINESLDSLMINIDLKGINLNIETGDEEIKCDRNWSSEAIKNILKNCIEHMDKGGTLSISTTETNLYNMITIKDNGSGIDPEDLPHVFERFYRGKKASSESVGIGLALSKTIMEKQGGEITVESVLGEGSDFAIKFYKTII